MTNSLLGRGHRVVDVVGLVELEQTNSGAWKIDVDLAVFQMYLLETSAMAESVGRRSYTRFRHAQSLGVGDERIYCGHRRRAGSISHSSRRCRSDPVSVMHLFVDEVAQTSDGTDVHSGVLYFLAQAMYVYLDGIGADVFVGGRDGLRDQLILTTRPVLSSRASNTANSRAERSTGSPFTAARLPTRSSVNDPCLIIEGRRLGPRRIALVRALPTPASQRAWEDSRPRPRPSRRRDLRCRLEQ